ncbi:MAG TPA: hypothetical protein V6D17_08120 [Candidatus Obscuribacterales bacterium]
MPSQNRTNQGRIGLTTILTGLVAAGFYIVALTSPHTTAVGGPYAPPQPPVLPPQQPPPRPPIFPTPPGNYNPKDPVFVPTDVTNIGIGAAPKPDVVAAFALAGIQIVPENLFPKEDDLGGSTEWILVRGKEGAVYTRPTPYTVKLDKGDIMVTVKRPSNLAIIETALGKVSVGADGDIIITYNDGVLRVQNLDGIGKNVMAKIIPPNQADPTVQLAPGFELVAGVRKLNRQDLKPRDGVARRHFKFLENGTMAVSEFSVESVIQNSDLIADIRQNVSGVKERRILSDMSKMASVLNYMRGDDGFSATK